MVPLALVLLVVLPLALAPPAAAAAAMRVALLLVVMAMQGQLVRLVRLAATPQVLLLVVLLLLLRLGLLPQALEPGFPLPSLLLHHQVAALACRSGLLGVPALRMCRE
jgi:hypothetical protein